MFMPGAEAKLSESSGALFPHAPAWRRGEATHPSRGSNARREGAWEEQDQQTNGQLEFTGRPWGEGLAAPFPRKGPESRALAAPVRDTPASVTE